MTLAPTCSESRTGTPAVFLSGLPSRQSYREMILRYKNCLNISVASFVSSHVNRMSFFYRLSFPIKTNESSNTDIFLVPDCKRSL